ncbi:unannotated protein [freshwater metagenome]|uniref:Unannotated protein n=1 Tax=freshwater metagenome TaxID=449393 RepID=A0A6J7KCD9_9ZZZZ|nr:hypothetical protein [Actinomycetota bacterium]
MNFKIKTILTAIATLGLLAGGLSVPAQAVGGSINLVESSSTLSGSTITGFDANATLRLAVIASMGTFSWNNNGSGATLVSNAGTTAQGVWLEGTQDQLNAALGEISFAKPCGGSYKLYAQVSTDGMLVNPVTGHLYQHSTNSNSYSDAIAAAAATPLVPGGTNTFGYMATITSPLENIIVSNFLTTDDWLAASDAAVEGDWAWIAGPETGTVFYRGRGDQGGGPVNNGFHNWENNEPNDWGGGEDIAQIYPSGRWNDIGDGGRYYTTEWGGMPGDDLSSVVIASDSLDITVAGALTGGGSQADPFIISDVASFQAMPTCSDLPYYFKQTANITLPTDWAGNQNLYGHYDGNGKTISYSPGTFVSHDYYGVWASSSGGSTLSNLTVTGDLVSTSYGGVGLLFGYGDAALTDVTASGSITTSDGRFQTGGVAGEYGGNLTRVHSTVSLNSTSDGNSFGGLVGYYWGTMRDSSWDGTMNIGGTGNSSHVGGLVGETDCASIYTSKATGTITVSNNGQNIGGLAGYFCGEMTDSEANVDIVGATSQSVGGASGFEDGDFYRVAAYGDVTGDDYVGGLFGRHWGNAENVYSHGNVVATNRGGSLVGVLESSDLYKAYATGTVTAATSRGLYGEINGGRTGNTHWVPSDSTVTQPDPLSGGEVPYTSVESKDIAYYSNDGWSISADWGDSAVWTICSRVDSGYPFLTSLYSSDPCAPALTNATAPVITGTGVVGKPLAMNKGSWDAGVTFSYQWKLDGANIATATAATYVPVAGDIGKTVTVQLTGAKQDFKTAVKLSSNSVVVSAAPVIVVPKETALAIGEFVGNSWWTPLGFVAKVKSAVKAHSKATTLTCTGIVSPGGWKPWQKTLGLKRAGLACAFAKSFNPKLKTKLAWKISSASDAVKRGVSLKFNK